MSLSNLWTSIKDFYAITNSPFNVTKVEDNAKITGYRSSLSSNAEIPSMIGRFHVRSIDARAFSNCDFLDKIWIRSGIEHIGASAFSSCRRLSQVHIEGEIKLIDHDAFYECKNLYWVELPPIIDELGDRCFYDCTGLKDITLPDTLKCIGNYAFTGTSIQFIKMPLSLEHLSRTAFDNCSKLEKIYVTKGSYADKVLSESPFLISKLRYVPQI